MLAIDLVAMKEWDTAHEFDVLTTYAVYPQFISITDHTQMRSSIDPSYYSFYMETAHHENRREFRSKDLLVNHTSHPKAWEVIEDLFHSYRNKGRDILPPFAFLDLFLDAIGEEENRKFQEYLEKGR